MRIFISYFIILIHSVALITAQKADSSKYLSLEPYDFHLQYLKADPVMLVDVRQFFEYKGRRIKDAINIQSAKDLNTAADTISRNTAFFLYCTDGYRSKRAAELLYDLGYRKLYNLEGGIVAWKRDGFPVEKGRVKRR